MTSFSLDGKIAIVTGGGSGIGEAISKRFADNGAHVHIVDRALQAAMKVADEIRQAGKLASEHECDISGHRETIATIQKIAGDSGVDILVNNAGIAHVGNVECTSESDLDRLYAVNIKGIYNCIYAIIPIMKKSGGGCILNVASVAACVAVPDRFAYSMTKGAVLTMTYSVAKDYVKHNIRCNSISPARIHTPFVDGFLAENYPGKEAEVFEQLAKTQPIGRMGVPDEVADLALFLCSDRAGFITGSNFPIDGGYIKLNS